MTDNETPSPFVSPYAERQAGPPEPKKKDRIDRAFEWLWERYPIITGAVLFGLIGWWVSAWIMHAVEPLTWGLGVAGTVTAIGLTARYWKIAKWLWGVGVVGVALWWAHDSEGKKQFDVLSYVGIALLGLYAVESVLRRHFANQEQILANQARIIQMLSDLSHRE